MQKNITTDEIILTNEEFEQIHAALKATSIQKNRTYGMRENPDYVKRPDGQSGGQRWERVRIFTPTDEAKKAVLALQTIGKLTETEALVILKQRTELYYRRRDRR